MSQRVASVLVVAVALLAGAASAARAEPPKKVLVTAFQPFGGAPINPSWQGVKGLNGKVIEGYEIVAIEMPVNAARVQEILGELLPRLRPAAYIAFGQGLPNTYSVERRADNEVTSGISESSGYSLRAGSRIRDDGDMVYRSTLPVDKIHDALKKAKFPVQYSDDPGGYVCEFTFYTARYLFEKNGLTGPTGFVHVPMIVGAEPTLESVAQGAELVVRTVLESLPRTAPEEAAVTTSSSLSPDVSAIPVAVAPDPVTTSTPATPANAGGPAGVGAGARRATTGLVDRFGLGDDE